MSAQINASVPEEVLKTARATIAQRVSADTRYQYIEGKHDHFAVVQAICDAILVERARCAELADYYAQASLGAGYSEEASGAGYYTCTQLAGEIRTPANREANPAVEIDADDLPF